MQIVFLGDAHLGARCDSQHFHEFFDKFYTNIFFPYLIENNIKTVIQLGDIFDRRKYSNHYTLDEAKRYFFSRFDELDIELITLLGNHDLYYRESLSVSSSELFLKQFKNVTVIKKPTQLKIFDISVIPWICKENYTECLDFIKNDTSHMCVGHFEVEGFKMYQNSILSEHGLSAATFSNYERVLSGHYHHASKRGNIEYIGTPYEITWQDFDDQKGFRVYDLETRTLETIENPYSIFSKVLYDDSGEPDVIQSVYLDKQFLKHSIVDKYVKIQIKNKTNPYLFDLFIDQVYQYSPIDVSIIEEIIDLEIGEDIDETDDTLTITYKYIDSINQQELDKIRLKTMMFNLYNEAMQVE
jgi:DNA repair exonuclease SbcCD nuclease subunit